MIACCTPSRGLIYSRTVESLFAGMDALREKGFEAKLYLSHDKPIPECHNYCIEKALADGADTIFFIEEDMYVAPDTFVAIATHPADLVTVQYNDKNGSPFGIIHKNVQGEVLWSGLGATAVKRAVLEALGTPYLSTDRRYKIVRGGNLEAIENPGSPWSYGGLDVDFYTRARAKGFKITVLENHRAHHFKLHKLGEEYTNNGCHDIREV